MRRLFGGWCERCASAAQSREDKNQSLRSSCPECQKKLGLRVEQKPRMIFLANDVDWYNKMLDIVNKQLYGN